ncbi:50S ribosomal protein L17 [Planctomycetota bacterium]
MRHLKAGRKLGRKAAPRKALARSITVGLVNQFGVENREYIVTTPAKAKEYRRFVEKLITLGRRALDSEATSARKLALRRRALKLLPNRAAVKKIFDEIAPRYKDRPGGYLRILKTGSYRLGDGVQKVLFAFVPDSKGPAKAVAPKPIVKKE